MSDVDGQLVVSEGENGPLGIAAGMRSAGGGLPCGIWDATGGCCASASLCSGE